MREWGLLNLEKKWWLVGDPVTVFSYLTGVYWADGARLDGRNKRTGNNGNDWQRGKHWSDRRKIFLTTRALSTASTCHSWLKNVQKSSQETYLWSWPCLEQEVRWESFKSPVPLHLLFSSKKSLSRNTRKGILPKSLHHSTPVKC